MLRGTLVAVTGLVVCSPAAAQEAAPPDVQRVFVLSSGGDEVQGHMLLLGPASVTMLIDGKRLELPLESILRIEARGDSVRNGFFIGAAIGVVAGLLSAREVSDGAAVPFALFSAGLWGLIGAGVDALIPGRTVIYSKPLPRAAGSPRPAIAIRVRF